jgi:peroxiredoxin
VPHLRELGERYRERGLSIVSVGIDEPLKLRNVARTLAIDYPILVADPENARSLLDTWGNRRGVIPYLVLIDRDGRVTATHRGPIDKDSLDELVRPALTAEVRRP